MVNVTLSIPTDMKHKMDSFAEINWSAVARQAFEEQITKLELVNSIVSKSKATEKDVEELSKKIKQGIWQRHEDKRQPGTR